MPEPINVIGSNGSRPQSAAPGYDHPWFEWSPIIERKTPAWPQPALVAVCVLLPLWAVEWEVEAPAVPPMGGRGVAPAPDYPRMSHREFGHRVGIFRLLDILAAMPIPVTAVVDVLTAECYPGLFRYLRPRISEFVAGGLSGSRPITSVMGEAEEEDYIRATLSRLRSAQSVQVSGWMSPEQSESDRTPGIVARAGLRYLLDWSNDEQVFRCAEPNANLWMFPVSWELSDVSALFVREVDVAVYADSLRDALNGLKSSARAGSSRLLALTLSPWLSGQAFRVAHMERVLQEWADDTSVWFATPGEIVAWCDGKM